MKKAFLSTGLLALCACSCDVPASTSSSAAAPASSAVAGSSTAAPSQSASAAAPPDDAAWLLKGSNDDRFVRAAKHFRGFDMAMVETAYRYTELYWAGKDRNWPYAEYQLKKIQTAVANGVERRPRRAASAQMLDGAVTVMKDALTKRDPAAFDTAFTTMTETCNACHQSEKVAFIRIIPPPSRTTVVIAPPESKP